MNLWKICFASCVLVISHCGIVRAETIPSEKPQFLYPFVRDGQWGFIDARGAWIIEPRFSRAILIFEKDRVRVEQGNQWGYIDRQGNWLVKPQFTDPYFGSDTPAFEIVSAGKKRGILKPSAEILLPTQYDDIALMDNCAFVRRGEKLGVFGLDGHWIKPLAISWPKAREMPMPAKSRAAWFRQGHKWGLLSHDGAILFRVQFAEHVMGRHESEEWDHPEGLDFKGGRAWVTVGKEYWLITDEGKVLSRQPFHDVRPWTDELYVFVNSEGRQGLISKDGEIALAARFSKIKQPSEGLAVVVEQKNRKKPDGETDTWWIYGYIDEHGKIIVEPGTYAGPGVPSGGQGELAPFSDGLAPVWNNSPGDTYDPYAGYIDQRGALVIPEQFYRTEPFSEGLGAFLERKPLGKRLSPDHGLWGFVDKTGALAVLPQFGWTTPFCRDRAWVLKAGCDPQKPFWAMIDRTGKVLTDYAFEPPERRTTWIGHEFFGGGYSGGNYSEADMRRKTRWRGDLAVVSRYDFHNGLATADGKILVEPIFNQIGEFHDGVAVAVDSRGQDEKGNVKFVTALITEHGEILANDTYTTISDFDHSVAWASHRWTDHRGPYQREGWGLIDTSAREVSELKYVGAHWVSIMKDSYTDNMCPKFYGELAPVASADGYQRYGEKVWELNSWGYMDRAGKIIAWHDGQPTGSATH